MSSGQPGVAVAILAKAPLPGLAKTRLIPRLGAHGAAEVQRWLLRRAVATAVVADIGPVTLWCAPDTEHPEFAVVCAFGAVTLRRQPEGDLGARMHAAAVESPGTAGTLIIGTDCPLLTAGRLRRAAARLRDHEATLIPAEDGGYALIGLRHPAPELFDGVAWSTGQVLAQTRERLATLGWRWHEDAALWDVDRPEDYERLERRFPGAIALPEGVPA